MRQSDWLRKFRKEVARLMRQHANEEIFKAEGVTLSLRDLEREQRQLSLCWRRPRKPP